MAKSFTFNGTDAADYGVKVHKFPEQEMADPSDSDHERGGTHGHTKGNVLFKPKNWGWVCELHAATPAQARDFLNRFKQLLDPRNGELFLVGDHWKDLGERLNYGIFAALTGPINAHPKGDRGFKFNLNWKATWPFTLTELEQGQTSSAVSGSPDVLYEPVLAGDTVKGTKRARPVFTFKNTDPVTLITITIANTTRSETMVINTSIPQNHYVRIDTEREHVEKSTNGTDWTTAMAGVSSSQDFLYLDDGVRNTITVTGVVTGELTITYRGEFL